MFRCRDIVSLLLIFFKECYCTFKNHELWSWKDNWCLQFLLSPIILTDLLGHGFDLWLVDFDLLVCFCVSRFIACDRNIMIDGCEKYNYEGSFWTLEFKCLWKVQLEHNQSKWPLGGRQLYGLQESYPFWESWEKSLGSWNTKGDTASHPDFMGGSSPTDWERVIGSPKNVCVEG